MLIAMTVYHGCPRYAVGGELLPRGCIDRIGTESRHDAPPSSRLTISRESASQGAGYSVFFMVNRAEGTISTLLNNMNDRFWQIWEFLLCLDIRPRRGFGGVLHARRYPHATSRGRMTWEGRVLLQSRHQRAVTSGGMT